MSFELTDFLGPECHSLCMDDEVDRKKINKLFCERMIQAKEAMGEFQHSSYISDEDLLVTVSLTELIEEFSYKFHLPELHAWAIQNYVPFRSIKKSREESKTYKPFKL